MRSPLRTRATMWVAANISRLESDLAPASSEKLKLWQAASETGPAGPAPVTGVAIATEESIHNLWWYAMCLLLVAVVAESLAASRYLNIQRESS